MTVDTTITETSTPAPSAETGALPWQPPLPPTDLIFDDGEPLETNRHRIAMNLLIRSAQWSLAQRHRSDTFVGGNMFVYYSSRQVRGESYRGPDFFAALGVDGTRDRQGWVVWEEEGHYPDVIIELLSASTALIDKGPKKDIYEGTFRTPDYFVFDPFDPESLQGWRLAPAQGYQALTPNQQGWLWSETLGLWLGRWDGVIDREPATGTCAWLRFYDPEGNLVPLPEEAAQQQAEQERQRAQQAEAQAQQAKAQAQQAKAQAQQERQRAQQAEAQAQQERQRAERLLALLRERGVDPDQLMD